MNLGLKEIVWGKGRFALMGAVVGLVCMLLVLLTGLTSGLSAQSISAVKNLDAQQIVFATAGDEKPSFTGQQVSSDQLHAYENEYGSDVSPLGISSARIESDGSTADTTGDTTDGATSSTSESSSSAQTGSQSTGAANVALFGGAVGPQTSNQADGTVIVNPDTASDLGILDVSGHLVEGSKVTVNGHQFTVSELAPADWYSHQPVVWMTLTDWQKVAALQEGMVGTVLLVGSASDSSHADISQSLLHATNTTALSPKSAVTALESYRSENGSLTLMQAFLYGISGLVIAAFVAVWTVQRTRDIAVLRALGASPAYVLRDSLTQALAVTSVGALLGGALGFLASLGVAGVVPFALSWWTVVLPVAGIVVLGLAAAWIAARRVSRIDPLLALGGN